MTLFSKKKEGKNTLVLLCDIGTARVAGALVLLKENEAPKILYQTEEEMLFQKELDFKRFTYSMLDALDAVLERIEREGFAHIHTTTEAKNVPVAGALISYASPWHISEVTQVTHTEKNNESFFVDKALLHRLVREEHKRFADKELAQREAHTEARMEIIEQQITGITLEGYTVEDPMKKKTTELSFTVAVTMMASALKGAVEKRIAKHVHADNIAHHSFGFIAFTTLRDVYQDIEDFLLVDVTGEITDAHVVSDTSLRDVVSFPCGTRSIIRRISNVKNIDIAQARSFIRAYARSHQDSTDKDQVVVEEALEGWVDACTNALTTLEDSVVLPGTVFCMIDEQLAPLFKGALENAITRLGMKGHVEVHILSAGSFIPHIAFRAGVSHNPFIATEALFAYRRVLE